MTTENQAHRERAAQRLAVAYALFRRARDTYDGSEESRAALRNAEAALETAELVALAVTLGGSLADAS